MKAHFGYITLLFLTTIYFCSCYVDTRLYFQESLSMDSWIVQTSIPNVFSAAQCASVCSAEHIYGNDCCYLVRYNEADHMCEIGKKSEDVDWNGNNLQTVSSRLDPNFKIGKYMVQHMT